MIIALWYRWTHDRHYRWLALCLGILVADLFVGSALIAWEISLMRDVMGR